MASRLSELRVSTSKITNEISDILSDRSVRYSGNIVAEEDVGKWSLETFRDVYTDKVMYSSEHVEQVNKIIDNFQGSLKGRVGHLMTDLNYVKENYYEKELDRLMDKVGDSELGMDFSNFFQPLEDEAPTFEKQFNHLYNSLDRYGLSVQQRYERSVEKEKQSLLEFRNLRDRVEQLDPNYDWGYLEGKSTQYKNKKLKQSIEDIPDQQAEIAEMAQQVKNPNFQTDPNASIYSQYKAYERELGRQNQRQQRGQELMGFVETTGEDGVTTKTPTVSFEDFNKAMQDNAKETKRAIWSVDGFIYKEDNLWFRSELDQAKYQELHPTEEPISVVQNFRPNFAELNQKTGAEWSKGYSALTEHEKGLYQQQFGSPTVFTSEGETIRIKNGDNTDWLTEQQQKDLRDYQLKEQRLENATQAYEELKSLRAMYQEREVKQFQGKEQETAVENPVGKQQEEDALTTATDEAQAQSNVKDLLNRARAKYRSTQQDVSEQTNELAEITVQQNTIGETQASSIERRAANSILMADTARSYTFGYKRKALLGMMGTTGAISLMEASMSGPNRDVVERKRQLEEERRRRQLGY